MAEPSNNQMAFWEAMKEKYERRNESLKYQEACLKRRLEQLKTIMEKQKLGDDCDCVPEKLEKPSLVQCLVQKGKNLILGGCKCVDSKIGENLLCACHIQDPNAPLNVDPNLCPNQEPPPPPDGCLNPTCDYYDPTMAHMAENPSTFSLKTTDIYYMDKLADLVKSEKFMQDKIEDLEKREHSYLTAIQDLRESMKKQPKEDAMSNEFKKMVEALEDENQNLRNELQDLRLELKHCFERIEGPLKRSLEVQKDKCTSLENRLKDLQAKSKMKEDMYLKEINEVKAKLCQACCTMVDLNNVNSKLKDDLKNLQDKCANLEDELVKQQMKEAENILKFKNMLSKRNERCAVEAKGDQSGQDLAEIAKKLGDTLKEVCPCVSGVPSGLQETAENIRELTELVVEKGAQQRKKRKGKIQQIQQVSSTSCACGSDKIPQTKSVTPSKADRCGNLSDKQIGNSSSATLVSAPMMNIGVSKNTSTSKSNMKKTASKSCTCCPAIKDCDNRNDQELSIGTLTTLCSCDDIENKRIGPSEEVIAVKNLGTLSIPPEEVVTCNPKPKREKLAVDTTVDVLDEPPKDIHIVTTIAKTGSLEITTEGPPGVVQTKVNYLPDGKIEIVTKLIDRNNMDDFLDGTLLQIPDGPPECDESETCGGQCEDELPGCPETDCDNSKTCGGTCSGGAGGTKDNGEKQDAGRTNNSAYGQVVINNFALFEFERNNPLLSKEWKNSNFDKGYGEESSQENILLKGRCRSKPKERIAIHEDIESGNELLKLSSRQSVTDVDKYQKDKKQITSCTSYRDVLDTISEADEQIDSSATEHKDSSFDAVNANNYDFITKTIDKKPQNLLNETTDRITTQKMERTENARYDEELKEKDFYPVLISTCSQEIFSPKFKSGSDAGRNFVSSSSSATATSEDMSSGLVKLESDTKVLSQDEYIKHQDALHPSTTNSLISKASTNYKITESFYKFSGNFNLTNAKMTLKHSKSMYEKKGNVSEYLRICKSASVSLSSLEVDLERLKLSSRHPTVGDYEMERWENRNWVSMDDLKLVSLSSNVSKGIACLKKNLKISGVLEKGYNNLGIIEPFSEHNYQCYVCCCSKKPGNEQTASNRDPVSNRDLEQRIDRLLEIDPLSSGVKCQCREKKKQETKTIQDNRKCHCNRKIQNDQPAQVARKEKDMTRSVKDPLLHDENCTCVDCICSPCNFKKYSSVMNVRFSCDCADICKCNPCKSEGAKDKQKMLQKTRKPPCKRCADKVAGSTVPAIPDTWKNVVGEGCHCKKSGCKHCHEKDENTPPVSKAADSSINCNCELCECLFCSGGKISRDTSKHDSGMKPKDQKTCACLPECLCDPCPVMAETVGEIGDSESCVCKKKEKDAEHDVSDSENFVKTCDCRPECSCDPCALLADGDHQKKAVEENAVCGGNLDSVTRSCLCLPECSCDPCPEKLFRQRLESERLAAEEEIKKQLSAEICSCRLICLCHPCAKLAKKDAEKDAEKENVIGDKNTLDSETEPCECGPTCTCASCKKEMKKDNLVPDKKTVDSKTKPCECRPKCTCAPCHKKMEKDNICDCQPKCECASCQKKMEKEKAVPEKNSMDSKMKPCECRPKCACAPCKKKMEKEKGVSDKNTVASKTENCECLPKCACSPCQKNMEKKNIVSDKKTEDSKMTSCDCRPNCTCARCQKKMEKVASIKTQEKVVPVKGTPDAKSCSCQPSCSCAPCLFGSKTGGKIGDSAKSKCDCEKCECDICFTSHELAEEVIQGILHAPTETKDEYDKRNFNKKAKCDCGTCECEACMGKRPPTPPEEGKNKGDCMGKRVPTAPTAKTPPTAPTPTEGKSKGDCSCSEPKNDSIKRSKTQTKRRCGCPPKGQMGDADRAREELKNVLDKIGSSCDKAEANLKPLVKKGTNFELTVSSMKLKLNNLQQKCNDKDQIIAAMTKELKLRSQSGVFADLLHELSHPKQGCTPDFTRTNICEALPKPKLSICGKMQQPKRCPMTRLGNKLEPILELDRYLPGCKEVCPCPRYVSGLEIIDIRRVTMDSILMKWRGPSCLNGITGYQVFVNDELKYRVLSPNRTVAVIDSLDLCCSLEVMLYAISLYGRCEPPALATYKI